MIRLKRKPKGEDYPDDVCAASQCSEPSGITLEPGILKPFRVPLCDKHNEKRCADDEAEADAAAAAIAAEQEAEPAVEAEPVAQPKDPPQPSEAQLEREAAWRAKVKAEKAAKGDRPKPRKPPKAAAVDPVVVESQPDPPPEEIPPPPELEEFINAPFQETPKPKPKRKRKPKIAPPTGVEAVEAFIDSPAPSGNNGNGGKPIPVNLIKRALIGHGVSAAEVGALGRQQIENWMAEHLPVEDRGIVLDKARRLA